MGFDIDMNKKSSEDGSSRLLDQVKPDWLKLDKGEKVRVAFLGNPVGEFVYDVRMKNPPEGENDYRGTYRSLTIGSGVDYKALEAAVASGDPDGILKVDAQILGKPNVTFAIPVVVYPTDKTGKINKELLAKKVLAVKFMKLTEAKFRRLQKERLLLEENNKTIFDVDFYVTTEEAGKAKKYLTWEFRALEGDALIRKHAKELAPVAQGLMKEEFNRLGIKEFKEVVRFLGEDMTETQWMSKLADLGYNVPNLAVSKASTAASSSNNGLTSGDDEAGLAEGLNFGEPPNLEDQIPFEE